MREALHDQQYGEGVVLDDWFGKNAPSDPWATAPADGNWERWFRDNVKALGLAPNPQNLASLKDALAKHGITLKPNAAGLATGWMRLPDGTEVDVGGNFTSGDPSRMSWNWHIPKGGADGGDYSGLGEFGDLMKAWEKEFTYPDFVPPPDFVAPTAEQVRQTPGFRFELDEGLKALERSAAAKGLLRTGGTAKALQQFGQNYADTKYGQAYQRALGEHTLKYGEALGEWEHDYAKDLTEFNTGYNIFEANQAKQFNRLAALAGLGQTAANQLAGTGAGYSSQYGNALGNYASMMATLLGAGANANASGIIGSNNAWGNLFGNLGQSATDAAMWWNLFKPNSQYATYQNPGSAS